MSNITSNLRYHAAACDSPDVKPNQRPLIATALSVCGQGAFAGVFCFPLELAQWFQPTVVGILWGNLFLAGMLVGGLARGKILGAIIAGGISYLSMSAFRTITDIGSADSLLLAASLLFAGWLATRIDTNVSPLSRSPHGTDESVTNERGLFRWSIWDMSFLTVIVACSCHALPRLDSPPELLSSVIAALLGGLLCNWIAYRWVWKDSWSLASLGVLALTLLVSVACVHSSAPSGFTLVHSLKWALTGPINVIASQATTVMLLAAIWRFDLARASC